MQEPLDNLSFTNQPKVDLKGSESILVMGIISLPFCLGLIGLILAIITLSRAKPLIRLYKENPEKYSEKSFKKVKAGRVCAIISLCLLGIGTVLLTTINL